METIGLDEMLPVLVRPGNEPHEVGGIETLLEPVVHIALAKVCREVSDTYRVEPELAERDAVGHRGRTGLIGGAVRRRRGRGAVLTAEVQINGRA